MLEPARAAVLDEAVPARPVGEPAVIRGQLARPLEAADTPRSTVPVRLPRRVPAAAVGPVAASERRPAVSPGSSPCGAVGIRRAGVGLSGGRSGRVRRGADGRARGPARWWGAGR
ncbi:hypothetical protein ACFVT2_17710 [Streptomyces sp. NPDC058000]|uniref:hypothetical protein n=1 Tax=Streptomyces sp. NPDC058000 TaxID=3346299 RepID=UPI0036ED97C8